MGVSSELFQTVFLRFTRLKHTATTGGFGWHILQNVPMLYDFTIFIKTENVHHRTAQAVWRWLAMNVQHHQIAFGNRTLDV